MPRPGQVLGLVGTNGIGKSTALKVGREGWMGGQRMRGVECTGNAGDRRSTAHRIAADICPMWRKGLGRLDTAAEEEGRALMGGIRNLAGGCGRRGQQGGQGQAAGDLKGACSTPQQHLQQG
jgi:hypothetical protein